MISLPGGPLTEADYQGLAASWIDRATADRALLRRVTSIEGGELVGQNDGRDYSGIVFPYIRPGESHPHEYRLRRDAPEVIYEKNAKKYSRKYLGPPGRGNLLYCVPGTPPEWLDDTELPLIITEGEKKAIALSRLAWHELSEVSDRPRFLVLALAGVWNWRGSVGKEPAPNGSRVDVKGVIPDFSRLEVTDRRVCIAYDSDVTTNDKVRVARVELARYLIHERGAQVHFVDIPANGADKGGIDDLLATAGPEKVLKIIDRAKKANIKKQATSQTAILSGMFGEVEFFHSPDLKPFATFPVNGHRETWSIRSQGFRSWLAKQFYVAENKPPSAQAVQETLALCEAQCTFDGPRCEIGIRVLGDGQRIFLDLAGDAWQAVEVRPSGWRVISDPDVKLRRPRGMLPLPTPISGNIRDLRRFVNAGSDQNWILIVSWLMAALNPTGPYPILILQGEQGTGKSTVARVLRALVDPSTASLRSASREERDLMIAAGNSWVISFDNLSGIQPWLSDGLCRLATGGGFATRELHTDSEEILLDASRPIILNGIDDIAGNGDLADRALIVTLPQVPEESRIPEKVFWRDFCAVQAGILGALLDAIVTALRNVDGVNLAKLPRMADFARWICAAAPSLPFGAEEFLEAYAENRRESVSLSIEGSPLASILDAIANVDGWEGTATELLAVVNQHAPEDVKRSRAWPKDARSLSNKVRRLAPLLRQSGLDVDFRIEGHQRAKKIILTRKSSDSSDRSDRSGALSSHVNTLAAGGGT